MNDESRLSENEEKPAIEYPCRWSYTIIGVDQEQLKLAISEIVEARDYSISLSNLSSKGKYCSLHLSVLVEDDEERISIFESLRSHWATQIVL